mgnify:CR=1 FL=1
MIQRFVIGKPFPTESVVLDLPAETGPVPYLTPDGDGWQYVMQEKDIVYGLGEMPRGLNKRGWHYETNNTDESEHGETGFPTTPPTISCSSPLPTAADASASSSISRAK